MPTPIANTWFEQAYYQETPDAFWRLGDLVGSTLADDQTVNAYIGTVIGGVTFGQTGWSGDVDSAALFNGTTGVINVGNVAALAYTGRVSVVIAFKTSDSTHLIAMISKALSATKAGWALLLDSGKLRFWGYTSAGSSVFDVSSPLSTYADGNWHLAVGTYDPFVANTVQVSVDGSVVATATPSGVPDSNSARALIGALDNAGTAVNFFNGSLDEAAVYPYAFTSGQITALNAARNRTMNNKALMQARAGVLRAGAGRSGFYTYRTIVLLNGVDVTAKMEKSTLRVTENPNEQPDTAEVTLFDKTSALAPSFGQTFVLADGATTNRLFGGTVIRVRRRSVKNPGGTAVAINLYDLTMSDWTWLLNRRTITKTYPAGSLASVVFLDIIATASVGFTTGAVQAGAPTLTAALVLKGVKVASALTALCQATSPNWNWYVDPRLDLHYFLTETSQRPKSLVPGNSTYDTLDYTLDLSQVRTRMLVEGGGARTTAPVGVGSTSIPVDECGNYSASGGTVVAPEGILITYTGLSTTSGPGNLTGVPASGVGAVTVSLLQGDALNVWVQVDDTAAQTALGLLELDGAGASTDGIHEDYVTVTNGTIAQCQSAGAAALAPYKTAVVTGTFWSRDRLIRTGKTISIALPVRGINVDVTIQQVVRTPFGVNGWQFQVTFATIWRDIVDVLKRVGQAA